MVADQYAVRAEDLRRWQAEHAEATPIGKLRPRHRATCVGVIAKMRLDPGRSLAVTIGDGTGELTAVWAGRTNLPGAELGGGLMLRGTVAVDAQGTRTMRNPEWTPVAEPYS